MLPEKFEIGSKTYDKDVNEDLRINMGNLNQDFADHAGKFAWYATAYELTESEVAKAKDALERLEAVLDYEVRQELETHGVKVTEAKVKNTLVTRPEYVEQQEKLRKAQLNAGLAKASRDAMIHRKDMLVGLGANYRAEGNADLSLKTQHFKK